ncbi:hypothetical protein D3C75_589940 [compost metagenome]
MLHMPVPFTFSVSPTRSAVLFRSATVVASMVCAPFNQEMLSFNGISSGTQRVSISRTIKLPLAITRLRTQCWIGKLRTSSCSDKKRPWRSTFRSR